MAFDSVLAAADYKLNCFDVMLVSLCRNSATGFNPDNPDEGGNH